MKQLRPLALILALVLLLGSAATTAFAKDLPTTVPVVTQADSEGAQENAPTERSFKSQVLILIAFAVGVGLLAAFYGLTTMRYNQDKLDGMKTESRKRIEEMRKKQQ